MSPDGVAVQEGQLHLHLDGGFVHPACPDSRADKGWVQVNEPFSKALQGSGHR